MSLFLIHECANAHGGDLSILKETIKTFSKSEFNNRHIKFQAFKYDKISSSDFHHYELYKELYNTSENWEEIIEFTSSFYDGIWLDIFDVFGCEIFVKNYQKIYGIKLQSSVLNNYEVLSALSGFNFENHKLILNISGFSLLEINKLVKNIITNLSIPLSNIVLQVGFQSYPTEIEDCGIHKISLLRKEFPKCLLSFADHTDGKNPLACTLPLISSFLGADFIEKHICLSREKSKYDGYSSLEPSEMKFFEKSLKVLSDISKDFINEREKEYLEQTIQIPLSSHKFKEGDIIGDKELCYRRTSQKGIDRDRLIKFKNEYKVLSVSKEMHKSFSDNDFRKANIGVLVACRMKSTRLRQKALLNIGEDSSINCCLKRCLNFSNISNVILCTSTLDTDNPLVNATESLPIKLFRGDPDDVGDRFLKAASKYSIDVIIRVTGDCPLISPEIADVLLKSHFKNAADYTTASESSVGLSCEIFNVNSLKFLYKSFNNKMAHSEYLTWYFKNNADFLKINIVDLPKIYNNKFRLTLDYEEDLELFNSISKNFDNSLTSITDNQLINFLIENKYISKINEHCVLKYKSDKQLIEKLDRETKLKI